MNFNQNCLSYWFPKIKTVVPVPRTYWIKISDGWDLMKPLDGEDSLLLGVVEEFILSACCDLGWPAFLRTGQTSGKHDWKNCCFLEDSDVVKSHILNLVEFSHIVSMMGLPHDVWVVREMLDVNPLFHCTAFSDMPVVRERRYFVDGGKILYSIPYWPKEALEQGIPDDENWNDKVPYLHESLGEDADRLAELSGEAVGGQWSVDILDAKNGLYVTDMAIAQNSYGWDEEKCK